MQKLRSDNDFGVLAQAFPSTNLAMVQAARARLDQLTKPQGSLGRLEDLAAWMCGWQQRLKPSALAAHTMIFAGNHGVAARGVSAFPSEVTVQMVANFSAGGAAINQLCRAIPSELRVLPIALDHPTADFTQGPAMTEEETLAAFNLGVEAVPAGAEVLVLGEMGIGNTTVAAALAYALCGGQVADWVGSGTGIDPAHLAHKRAVVEEAVGLHRGASVTTLRLLQHLGGRELAAMAGAVAAARMQRIPVILDGYVVTAAAATLRLLAPDALAHCVAGHVSVEPGHRRLLDWLGMQPLLDLGMRLGEGSGAQVALAVLRAALATYNDMATFEEAMVAQKKG